MRYVFEATYPNLMMEQYSEEIKYELKERAVRELVKQIGDGKYYVVRIFPSVNSVQHDNPYLPRETTKLRYEWEVSNVQTEKIWIPEIDFSEYSWKSLSLSAFDEIKKRLINKWKSIWNKLRRI